MLQHKHIINQFDPLVNLLKTLGQEITKKSVILLKLSLIQVGERYFSNRDVRGRRFCGISMQIVKMFSGKKGRIKKVHWNIEVKLQKLAAKAREEGFLNLRSKDTWALEVLKGANTLQTYILITQYF